MIFYRTNHGGRDLPVSTIRFLSVTSLAAYPAGALTLALAPDGLATSVIGFGLIALSLLSFAPLIGSSAQRIVGEEVSKLDEYELQLRSRAMNAAYACFTALTLLAVIYAAIAADKGGWVPDSYEEYNGLFWGVFLYAAALPLAILSFKLDPSFGQDS